jgi:simple sugar transport system ATP-binding protein
VTDEVELSLQGVGIQEGARWAIQDVTFDIHKGEIVGIAGVEGNGQRELVQAITGLRKVDTGAIRLSDRDITTASTEVRREGGIGYIPEDRQELGLLMPSPIWENAMLGHQNSRPFSRGIWVDQQGARDRAAEVVTEFGVRTPGVEVPVFALSGGNQQKLIVGREMIAGPSVLIAAQPTRGIDVGAQAAVWESIREARRAGLALLLLSADLEELIGLSDTLYVIFEGRLVARLDPNEVTPEILGSYMTGARTQEDTA